MKTEDWLITEQEAYDNSLLFNLARHCTRKKAFYPSLKPEGNHANQLTLTVHLQTEVLFGIKQQKTLQNSIQIHTTQNWKGTGTYIYKDCYSILT